MSKYKALAYQAAKELIKMPKAQREAEMRKFDAGKPELGKEVRKAFSALRHQALNQIPPK
jgi:hypothetical protein